MKRCLLKSDKKSSEFYIVSLCTYLMDKRIFLFAATNLAIIFWNATRRCVQPHGSQNGRIRSKKVYSLWTSPNTKRNRYIQFNQWSYVTMSHVFNFIVNAILWLRLECFYLENWLNVVGQWQVEAEQTGKFRAYMCFCNESAAVINVQ